MSLLQETHNMQSPVQRDTLLQERMRFSIQMNSLFSLSILIQSQMLQLLTELMQEEYCSLLETEMELLAMQWEKERIMKMPLKLLSKSSDIISFVFL